jgi:ABC-2 type transport system permease protein
MTTQWALEAPARRYGLKQVLSAELTKLTTLRSTVWTLAVTVLGTFAVTILATNGVGHHDAAWYQGFDATNQSLTGLALGTLAIGVLGVLAATGEYGTGTIRSSLAATPRRPLFLLGKVLVVGAVALVVGEVLTFSSFWIGQAVLLSGGAPSASLGDPGVLRAVMLSGAFLALVALVGLALGVIIRHTAGAIAVFVGVAFLLPVILQRLPDHLARFTPLQILANSVASTVPNPDQLSAWTGFSLMILYTVVLLGVAAVLLVRRDA